MLCSREGGGHAVGSGWLGLVLLGRARQVKWLPCSVFGGGCSVRPGLSHGSDTSRRASHLHLPSFIFLRFGSLATHGRKQCVCVCVCVCVIVCVFVSGGVGFQHVLGGCFVHDHRDWNWPHPTEPRYAKAWVFSCFGYAVAPAGLPPAGADSRQSLAVTWQHLSTHGRATYLWALVSELGFSYFQISDYRVFLL